MPRGTGIYSGINCVWDENRTPFAPTSYQLELAQKFLDSPYKGMCMFWQLGSGKTCAALLVADSMLANGLVQHVYIFTPGSLRQGWITEYCKKCGYDKEYIKANFTFATYNYSIPVNVLDLNNCLVIIDEAHNLINSVKNGTKTAKGIYTKILESNCRVLALTGTFNSIDDFGILGKLLKPGDFFPEPFTAGRLNPVGFASLFNTLPDGRIIPKNPTSMRERLEGIVSYFPGAGKEFVPNIEHQPPFLILMTPDQDRNYWKQVVQERKFNRAPSQEMRHSDPEKYKLLNAMFIMARKNILSRMASNFCYPEDVVANKIKDALEERGGWIGHNRFDQGELKKIYSTKITALLLNIIAHNQQKHVIFTSFKKKSGAELIHSIMNMCGISNTTFTGDLDDSERMSVLRRFNSPENVYGDEIRVLIVTEAGAEGISILHARHMHILESSPRVTKSMQAIGRVARYMSHSDLPKEQQNVKIWRYWSVSPKTPVTVDFIYKDIHGKEQIISTTITDKRTTDEILYEKGEKQIETMNSFIKILSEVSVTSVPNSAQVPVPDIPGKNEAAPERKEEPLEEEIQEQFGDFSEEQEQLLRELRQQQEEEELEQKQEQLLEEQEEEQQLLEEQEEEQQLPEELEEQEDVN